MNAKHAKTAAAVLVLSALPGLLAAQPMDARHPRGRDRCMDGMMFQAGSGGRESRPLISYMLRMQDKLGLSAEQVAKLNELRTAFEKEAIKTHAEARSLGVDLEMVLSEDKVDLVKAEELIRKQDALHTSLRLSRLKTLEAGKAVLTPAQLANLRKMLEGPAPRMGPAGKREERKDRMPPVPASRPGTNEDATPPKAI